MLDRPKLTSVESYYFTTFYQLSGSRRPTEGVSLIPMSEYAAYFSTYRITDIEEIDLTLKYLCAMDAKYVALVAERIKSDRAKDR